MAKSLLTPHRPIPSFSLPGRGEEIFDTADIRRKDHLVLFFLTEPHKAFLASLDEACGRLREKRAAVVVVVACAPEKLAAICQEHRLLFVLLADPDRQVTGRYLDIAAGEEAAALFVADRFGALFFQYVAPDVSALPSCQDIEASLAFIESQNPEGDASF